MYRDWHEAQPHEDLSAAGPDRCIPSCKSFFRDFMSYVGSIFNELNDNSSMSRYYVDFATHHAQTKW